MSYSSFKEHQRNLRVVTVVATHDRTDLLSLGVLTFLAVAMVLLVSVNRINAKPSTAKASQMDFANNIQQSTWTNSNCNNCHTSDALFSHPVNVSASMSIPLGLPLENGRVTCITCHDNSSSELHAIARVNHTSMLRDTGQVSLCQQCHDPMQSSQTAMHGAMLGQAHMTPMSTRRSFGSMPKRSFIRKVSGGASGAFVGGEKIFGPIYSGNYGMDRQSRSCLSCHDGSIASDVFGGGMGIGRGFGASGNRGGEHPIGMTYPTTGNKVVSTGSQIAFALPMSLDQRIQLVDGKVSCISCHSPYSKEKNLLVMSNDRSKLCLSCHMD